LVDTVVTDHCCHDGLTVEGELELDGGELAEGVAGGSGTDAMRLFGWKSGQMLNR
jgi:hypothetical protein